MSEFKGTPGPWEAVNGSDVFTRLGGRNASGVAASKNDGWHVADCDMGPSSTEEGAADIPHAEKLANARLIAAAPDLLTFAETFIARIEDDGEPTPGTRWHAEYVAARAAIAKATGEPQ